MKSTTKHVLFLVGMVFVLSWVWIQGPNRDQPKGVTLSNLGRMVGTAYAAYYWGLFPLVVKEVTEAVPYDLHGSQINAASRRDLFSLEKSQEILNRVKSEKKPSEIDILFGPEDVGIVFVMLLSSWARGDFYPVSIRLINLIIVLIAYWVLFQGLNRSRQNQLAFLLPGLLLIHPTIFRDLGLENITVYPILALITVLGLMSPFLFDIHLSRIEKTARLVLAVVSLSFFCLIRGLSLPALLVIGIGILFYDPHHRGIKKVVFRNSSLGLAILVVFLALRQSSFFLINRYQWKSVKEIGLPLSWEQVDKRFYGHSIVHSIWCGLGDFGNNKGYSWNDREAFLFALSQDPVLSAGETSLFEKERYGAIFRRDRTLGLSNFPHPDVFFNRDRYNQVLIKKIAADIQSDPFWFLGIILKRFGSIMMQNGNGILSLISVLGLIICLPRKELLSGSYKSYLKFFLATSSLTTIPLFVFSRDFGYYYLGHCFLLALLLVHLVKLFSQSKTVDGP